MGKKKKNKFVFHLVLIGQKKTNEKKHTHDKKLRKTKQQMITDTNKDVYTGTFLDSKAPSIRNVMGLFPDENINLVPKASCDDPKPSLSFCLPIVATPFPSTVGVLYLFVCRSAANGSARKIKVISTTQKNLENIYIFPKKLLKIGCGKGLLRPSLS